MAQALKLSRRACCPSSRIPSLRTPLSKAIACSVDIVPSGVAHVEPSVSSLAGRDRTAEASTSQQAVGGKTKRIPPSALKPNIIYDIEILQNGVILVDKPLGWTSFDVCGKIRNMLKFLGIKKVGHAGTLDPNASGLLIVCTGRGTKFCDDFMAQDKEYSGTFRLGEGTASYDAESEVSERAPWEHITDSDLEAAALRFMGDIMQVPPMFSALKVGGQKLYQLAREGQSLELPARPITITGLRVWRSEDNRQDVHFHVACSKGTYIRSLAYDMGRALGSAAHLVALRREAVGEYRVAEAWDLRQLIEQIDVHKKAFHQRQQQEEVVAGAEAAGADATAVAAAALGPATVAAAGAAVAEARGG